MAQAASERERAFVALYERHYGQVLTYARRRTDEASARDVVAETFTVAWRRGAQLREIDLPWLMRTAALVLKNQQRAGRRQQRTADRLAAQPDVVTGDPALDGHDRLRVANALDAMSPRDRELLQLVAWEQLSTAGVAAVLGCTTGTAAVRLHRARRRLGAALAADDPDGRPGEGTLQASSTASRRAAP